MKNSTLIISSLLLMCASFIGSGAQAHSLRVLKTTDFLNANTTVMTQFKNIGFTSANAAAVALEQAELAAKEKGLAGGETILCGGVEAGLVGGMSHSICTSLTRSFTMTSPVGYKISMGAGIQVGAYYFTSEDMTGYRWCYLGVDAAMMSGTKFMKEYECTEGPKSMKKGTLIGVNVSGVNFMSISSALTLVQDSSYF